MTLAEFRYWARYARGDAPFVLSDAEGDLHHLVNPQVVAGRIVFQAEDPPAEEVAAALAEPQRIAVAPVKNPPAPGGKKK